MATRGQCQVTHKDTVMLTTSCQCHKDYCQLMKSPIFYWLSDIRYFLCLIPDIYFEQTFERFCILNRIIVKVVNH